MKCFLHIGTEKTATTTLQEFFNINRSKLLDNGFIYTKSAGKTNNRSLPIVAYNLDRRDDCTKRFGLNTNEKLLNYQNRTITNLKKEISSICKKHSSDSLILSSEHIQSRLTDINELKRLKEIIYSLGVSDIYVIIYLRRPAEIANSLHSTAIKAGWSIKSPPSVTVTNFHKTKFSIISSHQATLEKFGAVFGESNLIPRLFDKQEFENGNIIDDILKVMEIPESSFIIPDNLNESLSALGVELICRLNETIPAWVGNKQNPIRVCLLKFMKELYAGEKYVMPTALFKEYDLFFKESNEWVRENYFPTKKKLFNDKVPNESSSTLETKELSIIARLITKILKDK